MVDFVPLISAVIGAVSGSFGAQIFGDWNRQRNEKIISRNNLISKYLLQFQDVTQSLLHRLASIKRGGHLTMGKSYYEQTTLYALGCMLAYKRILILDGIYSQISGFLYLSNLKMNIELLDKIIDKFQMNSKFYRYERLALAEAVIIRRKDDSLSVCTYLEFKTKYEDPSLNLSELLEPSKKFVEYLKDSDFIDEIMPILKDIVDCLSKETKISNTIGKITSNITNRNNIDPTNDFDNS